MKVAFRNTKKGSEWIFEFLFSELFITRKRCKIRKICHFGPSLSYRQKIKKMKEKGEIRFYPTPLKQWKYILGECNKQQYRSPNCTLGHSVGTFLNVESAKRYGHWSNPSNSNFLSYQILSSPERVSQQPYKSILKCCNNIK